MEEGFIHGDKRKDIFLKHVSNFVKKYANERIML